MKHNSPTLCPLKRLHAEIGGKIIDKERETPTGGPEARRGGDQDVLARI
jgi:hypothetical protein